MGAPPLHHVGTRLGGLEGRRQGAPWAQGEPGGDYPLGLPFRGPSLGQRQSVCWERESGCFWNFPSPLLSPCMDVRLQHSIYYSPHFFFLF